MSLGAAMGPMPPWHQFHDFLSGADHQALLLWTLSKEAEFVESSIIGGVDKSRRVSAMLRDLGPLQQVIEERVRAALPEIFSHTGGRPFEVEHVELEIAAHNQGAFFVRHVDVPVGRERKPLGGDGSGTQDRLISAVYYYHREPKAFEGGALRLHRFGGHGEPGGFVDIAPEQNSLVVFPSWAEHEVLRVSCPSGAFANSRFAVNAWLCRTLDTGGDR